MLTALVETADRIAGLDAGADDYVVKPFDVEEVFARLRALLRRTSSGNGALVDVPKEPQHSDRQIEAAGLRMDMQARRAWRGGRELELTRTEFELLELLVRNAGIVLDHSTIYDRIWGYDFGPGSKNLAVYVGYLRRKLDDPGAPALIHTVRGVGYVLRED
jgi:two-component system response regulator MprA